MSTEGGGARSQVLSNRLVGGGSTADLVDDEHESILAEGGEVRPELILRDALAEGLALQDELEHDEASEEVDHGADDQTEQGVRRVHIVSNNNRENRNVSDRTKGLRRRERGRHYDRVFVCDVRDPKDPASAEASSTAS